MAILFDEEETDKEAEVATKELMVSKQWGKMFEYRRKPFLSLSDKWLHTI